MKLLDCTCGHYANSHASDDLDIDYCNLCACEKYDPAGHNPEVYNITCPQCRRCLMVPHAEGRYYGCLACDFILFDRQVRELCELRDRK